MRASSAILLAMLVAASSVVVRVYLSGGVTALKRGAITTAHTMLTVPNMFISDSRGLPADCLALETLMRFRRRPETIGSDSEEVALSRNGLDGLDVLFPPHDCVITEKNASNVKTFRLHPRSVSTASKNVIIYLHGGAYIGGSLKSHGAFACELGAAAKATVLFVDYTRAPEKLHPGGVEEAITAIKWISSYGRIDMSNVIIVGDSAGGGMALLATQHFIKLKSRMPQAVVVLSPWADLTATATSLTSNAERDYVLNPARTRNWVRIILGENAANASSPAYSPLFGSFSRFPPLYISVGTAEGLYDDSIAVAKKALDAGAPVELSECPHMQHVVPFFRHFCSNADKEFENIVRFMLSHFNRV